MRRLLSLILLACACSAPIAAARGAAAFPPEVTSITAEDLDRAIEALAEGLVAAKDPRRFWDPRTLPADEAKQPRGWTAIVLLALIEAGISPQDPRIADAVEALADASIDGTYAVSVRAMLWAALPDRHRRRLETDASWLLSGFSAESRGWDYRQQPQSRREDNSITQFASLALWLAAARGVEVPSRLWELLEARYLASQMPDGGWNYEGRGDARGSMTAAGVATLFMLDRERDPRRREREQVEAAIAKGLAWLDARFDPARNPGHHDHEVYWLYSLERAALAGGLSRLGGRDWFREGAAALVARLCEPDPDDPSRWRMRLKTPRGATIRLHEHALGLLYLLRGRVPIAIGVLAEPQAGPLAGSREANGFAAWLGETAEREFNWLRIESDSPVDSWLEPAILWWHPTSIEAWQGAAFVDSLRRFLASGGLLVADLGELPPRDREAMKTRLGGLFPSLDWKAIESGHPARRALFGLSNRAPSVESLSNGVRDLAIVCSDGSLARGLEQGPGRGSEAHKLLANLWVLAVETDGAWPRLRRWNAASLEVAPPPPTASATRVAIVRHGEGDDPEPAALELARPTLESRLGRRLDLVDVAIEALPDEATPDRRVLAILRGTRPPSWEEARWLALSRFIEQGGTLLVESPGGRGGFAEAVEEELVRRLGRPAFPLANDPMLAGDDERGREDLRRATYRPTTARASGAATSACRLRGVRDAVGRVAIITSSLDCSFALLGRPREGVDGYTQATAIALLTRILEHASAAPTSSP
ncbi:MAG: hypothetical protein ACO3SJ_01675 [Phycisphaerales bacterium]